MKCRLLKSLARLGRYLSVVLLCLTTSAASMAQEADVILVVDTSGSTEGEVLVLQSSLNEAFTLPILNASVDLQISLIGSSSICIPAPTGSGSCQDDDNLPLYKHVVAEVGGTDALTKILTTYADWQSQIRPNSKRTIVVLTDGASDITAEDFDASLLILDPALSGYRFHGIVSSCPQTSEYAELAAVTGGTCNVASGAEVAFAMQEVASIIINDFNNPPPPPPPTTCEDSAAATLDAGTAYVKAARVAKRTCRKAQDENCVATVLQVGDAFHQLSTAQSSLATSCP